MVHLLPPILILGALKGGGVLSQGRGHNLVIPRDLNGMQNTTIGQKVGWVLKLSWAGDHLAPTSARSVLRVEVLCKLQNGPQILGLHPPLHPATSFYPQKK